MERKWEKKVKGGTGNRGKAVKMGDEERRKKKTMQEEE